MAPRKIHALALARYAHNQKSWLRGDFFGFTSKATRLQDLVGDGGTLWLVVSRRRGGHTTYSVTMRLRNCKRAEYKGGGHGRHGVLGDAARSEHFSENDAKLLMLGLRFDPSKPITHAGVIGNSLQTPRVLNANDIRLLESHTQHVDRWSVFISYHRHDRRAADKLARTLQAAGYSVFRDVDSLRGGQKWWPIISDAIRRARHFILLVGAQTHSRKWVRKEVQLARSRRELHFVPALLQPEAMAEWPSLCRLHACNVDEVLEAVSAKLNAT